MKSIRSRSAFRIENIAGVENSLLEDTVERCALPDDRGRVLVIVGAPKLSGENNGECIPRSLVDVARSPALYHYLDEGWDCGVVLSRKLAAYATTHPGFFVQVLAHELGHAHVVLTDPELHIYCSFIDRTIGEAARGEITMWHELPHEQAHDAFGMYVAEHVVGRDTLCSNIALLLDDNTRRDHQRLQFLSTLTPRPDVADLRMEVKAFAQPYAGALIGIWDRWVRRAEDLEEPSMVQRAHHIRSLFK